MKSLFKFLKREIVFSIACLLAIISAFFVTPSKEYLGYINFQTLALLLALMLVVQGLNSCGLFNSLVNYSMKKIKNTRQLAVVMILLCYMSSMFITNDVALITFVPFTIILLELINDSYFSIWLIILETMAANLGSMFTPIGNPQNLYLYSISGLSLPEFLGLMLPYTGVALGCLLLTTLVLPKKPLEANKSSADDDQGLSKGLLILYVILFAVCILTVLDILDYRIMLGIVLAVVFVANKKLILKADYVLLLTFIAFFVFIGNIKNIDAVSTLLSKLVTGKECVVAILASQVVSNVPAAVLLSGFTEKYNDLIIGVNFGGLGTLIASMASLISYKFYVKLKDANVKKYIVLFTELSVLYLLILYVAYMFFD